MVAVERARRARSWRWLGCLMLCGALVACQGSGGDEAAHEAQEQAPQTQAEAEAELEAIPTNSKRIRVAPRPPDGGMPDGGPMRYELEGKPRPRTDTGPRAKCPPGQYACCNGSCSPDRNCPGVACDPAPAPTFTK